MTTTYDRTWRRARLLALDRARHRCERCKCATRTSLVVHHVDDMPDAPDAHRLDNLVVLCRRCHHDEHVALGSRQRTRY